MPRDRADNDTVRDTVFDAQNLDDNDFELPPNELDLGDDELEERAPPKRDDAGERDDDNDRDDDDNDRDSDDEALESFELEDDTRDDDRRGRSDTNDRVSHTDDVNALTLDQRGNVIVNGTKIDNRGNVVDVRTGRVLARAGTERRYFDSMNRARFEHAQERVTSQDYASRLEQAITIGRELAQQVQTLTANKTTGDDLGLTKEEQIDAMRSFQEIKRDPAAGLQRILTRAAANGIDLSKLGLTGSFNPQALLQLVREEIGKTVKPINDLTEDQKRAQQQEQQQAELRADIQRDVESFFRTNPRAVPYMPVFNQVLADSRFKHMSLGEIWARIELNELQRRGTRRGASHRSRPNGRRSAMNGSGRGRNEMAPVNESYDSILRGVLTDYGD